MTNIFSGIPSEVPNEIFEDIVKTDALRIERIISKGQTSPESGWYEQPENEWFLSYQAMVLLSLMMFARLF